MPSSVRSRKRKKVPAGPADLAAGERRIVQVDGKSIGIFNIGGEYYALLNYCPHMAGNLCEGPVTGTALPTSHTEFRYGKDGEIIRCGWHGWEFEIKTGQCLVDQKMRARKYDVTVEKAQLILHI